MRVVCGSLLVLVWAACGSETPAQPDAACEVGAWCGNDCNESSDACWACGELRYDAECNCRPVASTCFRPDCSAPGPGVAGDYCGMYWWCDRACGDGLECRVMPDRPAATHLLTCQLP